MSLLLVPEQLVGFYSYSAVISLSVLAQCPLNMNTEAPRIWAFQMIPRTQNKNLFENGCNNFDKTSEIYGNHLTKQNYIGEIY
jgi:hypothetical protein